MSPELTIIGGALAAIGVLSTALAIIVPQAWSFIKDRFKEKQEEAQDYKKQRDQAMEILSELNRHFEDVKAGSKAHTEALDAMQKSVKDIMAILEAQARREKYGG